MARSVVILRISIAKRHVAAGTYSLSTTNEKRTIQAKRNLLKREQSKLEHNSPNRYIEVGMNSLHRIQAAYIPVKRGSQNAPPQRIPQGSGEVLERDRGFANPLSLFNRPREE